MGSNITYIKPAKFAEIVEQPYLKIDWRGYNLGAGYGNVFGRNEVLNGKYDERISSRID